MREWRALASAWDIPYAEFLEMTPEDLLDIIEKKDERRLWEMRWQATWSLMIAESMAKTELTPTEVFPPARRVKW